MTTQLFLNSLPFTTQLKMGTNIHIVVFILVVCS